ALIGVEGGHMIDENLACLDSLYARGARYLTLTWNNSTSWASSAQDEVLNPKSLKHKGLNEFGVQVVKRMNELGMMVDLSHAGEATFWEALKVTTRPVILSHSSVYAICPHYRNLKDEQIKAVAENGGLICVNFFSGYLDPSYNRKVKALVQKYPREADSLRETLGSDFATGARLLGMHPEEGEALRAPLFLLIDHIDYIVRLVGVDHVGLGSDFDGIGSLPKGLDDVSDFSKITEALKERGYSDEDIRKILGENFLRVFRENGKS
ncbi:MAG TPA: dipeptidase, partial [Anseongella sp.]|nr:dipeptidase [Anseongella sp.]